MSHILHFDEDMDVKITRIAIFEPQSATTVPGAADNQYSKIEDTTQMQLYTRRRKRRLFISFLRDHQGALISAAVRYWSLSSSSSLFFYNLRSGEKSADEVAVAIHIVDTSCLRWPQHHIVQMQTNWVELMIKANCSKRQKPKGSKMMLLKPIFFSVVLSCFWPRSRKQTLCQTWWHSFQDKNKCYKLMLLSRSKHPSRGEKHHMIRTKMKGLSVSNNAGF